MQLIIPTNGTAMAQPVIPTPEPADRLELFPEEDFGREDEPLVDSMPVTQKIFAIRHLEKAIEQYDKQDRESRSFYAQKKQKCEEQIEFIKRMILNFLQAQCMKNIQTPAGTAYQKVVTTKQWPSDDALVAWVQAYLPEAIRTKKEPDKKAIIEHMKRTGETPDGYSEDEETRLYIK
jgi:hypothetical protein